MKALRNVRPLTIYLMFTTILQFANTNDSAQAQRFSVRGASSSFIPIDSWVYPVLDRLSSDGYLLLFTMQLTYVPKAATKP